MSKSAVFKTCQVTLLLTCGDGSSCGVGVSGGVIFVEMADHFLYDMTLSKRYWTITIMTVGTAMLWMLFFVLDVIRYFLDGPSSIENIYDTLTVILNFLFSISTSSREWQQFMDTNAQSANWYFQHRKTYGDYNWTKRRWAAGTAAFILLFILLYAP